MDIYKADANRYEKMPYRRCGNSGLKLSPIALGFWYNFGGVNAFENSREMVRCAFDSGITYYDLANNYGPPVGSAEETFGKIMEKDLKKYRDEIIVATKAGYTMWDGPYGDHGSKKYLISSLNQSLKRLNLDYVDIFYHHCPDPETPLEETMDALAAVVRQGKALYVGISNYRPEEAARAVDILKSMSVHCLVHQPSYSMFNRWIEDELEDVLEQRGVGIAAYAPLYQGMLTDRYLKEIPDDSRAGRNSAFLKRNDLTPEILNKIKRLNEFAKNRGQSLAQMAISWVLRGGKVSTAIIGASRASQIQDCVKAVDNLEFTNEELVAIDEILKN